MVNDKMHSIVQRTLQLRKTLGLSQEGFAKRMRFSRNYISLIERGEQDAPSHRFIEQLESLEREASAQSGQIWGNSLEYIGQISEGDPRRMIIAALKMAGMSLKKLSQETGYSFGVLQAVINGQGRASEKMIEAICKVLPSLNKDDLMAGSDQPTKICQNPGEGTFGSKPDIRAEAGEKFRYVPLLSLAQAGAWDSTHTDEAYDYTGVLTIDIPDPKAFAVQVRGSSMEPKINEGDRAIVCPSWSPQTGDTVLAKTKTGDVMIKLYQAKDSGRLIVLSSWNPAFPPLEFGIKELEFIFPIAQVTQSLRKP